MSDKVAVVAGLVADLRAEHRDLVAVLEGLDEADWARPTPAEGWDVRAQVSHLAHFDDVTRQAVAQPDAFVAFRDGLGSGSGDGLQAYVDAVGPDNAHRPGPEMIAWWREANDGLATAALAAAAADSAARVPWFGPAMSLPSKITARIMETWAHGQDVVDALGVEREPTPRLAHVTRIGVLALPNSFRARGLEVPTAPVHVDLEAPDGSRWTWGDPAAADVVRGTALDFCLVATQRRHPDDTGLVAEGEVGRTWLSIAQAFAGAPGAGRRPGQFAAAGRSGRSGRSA